MTSERKSASENPAKEPGPSSSDSICGRPKIDPDIAHADQEISKDEEPGPSTSTPSAATDRRPSAHLDSEHPDDRTLPSLAHQTSTLLNWSILEQLRLSNEIYAEMARMQRLQTLMQIGAMPGAPNGVGADYYMNLLRGIPRAQAPDSILGPEATRSWDRLSSPNQYLMQAASGLSFAHESIPAPRSNAVTGAFAAAEKKLTDSIEESAARDRAWKDVTDKARQELRDRNRHSGAEARGDRPEALSP
ncbi:uncharacterized protein PAN0_002d1348 [Moesziomyces antarcticus]|uniref:Uncharacterized protein n=1 Tax=Pseudozyma antarctica TaxID=84753 RepID=A0A5C3FGP0_PSEA2|nr:uncharacterized protein PAN0_002d1348 [Moesziomyces antarcticus]GAK63145.1 hypothetical protein PAN0_002d1348 [Moesziomyces antarcticus]SPO43370.1 uncharacterized protein PSANT_01054 [Moesziomyces antarcticus]